LRLLSKPPRKHSKLAARAPEYGPVFNELGEEYTRAIGSTTTQDLLNKQAEAYTTLLKLEEQQLFTRYYIDKALAEKRLDDADKTLAAYSGAQTALSNIEDATAYTYKYSLDNDSLSDSLEGFAIGTIQVTGLTQGEHTLYIQATAADGTQTELAQFPFTVK
jgi:hypothetical protein